MLESSWEEKQKDEVLQKINDILDKHDWGGSCDRLVVKFIFSGRFNLEPVIVQRKEKMITCGELDKALDSIDESFPLIA